MIENKEQFINYDVINIEPYDFVKYLKCIYLVKEFQRTDNGLYVIEYYFRSIKKENAKLHSTNSDKITGYLAEKIKKATTEEIRFLTSRIKSKKPNFDLSLARKETNENTLHLNEDDCIAFLKNKGYLVYKQI